MNLVCLLLTLIATTCSKVMEPHLSERHACTVVGLSRDSFPFQSRVFGASGLGAFQFSRPINQVVDRRRREVLQIQPAAIVQITTNGDPWLFASFGARQRKSCRASVRKRTDPALRREYLPAKLIDEQPDD